MKCSGNVDSGSMKCWSHFGNVPEGLLIINQPTLLCTLYNYCPYNTVRVCTLSAFLVYLSLGKIIKQLKVKAICVSHNMCRNELLVSCFLGSDQFFSL